MPRVLPGVLRWKEIARKWATQTGLTASLVLGLIHQESGGNERAYRFEPLYHTGRIIGDTTWERRMDEHGWEPRDVSASYGLTQLMFPTAWGYGCRDPKQLYDPDYNIRLGCAHLAALRSHAQLASLPEALAAYNGGNGGAADYRAGRDTAPVRYSRNVLALAAEYRTALGG